jgi:hypothetical protein
MKLNTFVECTFQRKNFTLYQKSKGDKYLSEKKENLWFCAFKFPRTDRKKTLLFHKKLYIEERRKWLENTNMIIIWLFFCEEHINHSICITKVLIH